MKRLLPGEARRLSLVMPTEPRAVLVFLAATGARVSEALAVRSADVDVSRGVVFLRTLKRKGGKRPLRELKVGKAYAADLVARAADDGRVFKITRQGVWSAMKKAAAKVGIDPSRVRPHALRHGFAIEQVEAGVPLPVLRKWLGHASYQSTLVYTEEVEAAKWTPRRAM